MSNYSRRPVSSQPSGGERDVKTKSDLIEMLEFFEFRIETKKINKGEWNEMTDFWAVNSNGQRYCIGYSSPRDRRNWQAMWNEFKRFNGITT